MKEILIDSYKFPLTFNWKKNSWLYFYLEWKIIFIILVQFTSHKQGTWYFRSYTFSNDTSLKKMFSMFFLTTWHLRKIPVFFIGKKQTEQRSSKKKQSFIFFAILIHIFLHWNNTWFEKRSKHQRKIIWSMQMKRNLRMTFKNKRNFISLSICKTRIFFEVEQTIFILNDWCWWMQRHLSTRYPPI
jgi:hypothetical protein